MGSDQYSKRLPLENIKGKEHKRRAKTFRTEEKAHAYAKENSINNYELYKLSNHKFRIDKK